MRHATIAILLMTLLASAAYGQEEKKDADKKKDDSISLSGTFESTKVHEVIFETEQVAAAKIKSIVAQGAEVTRGDTVVTFETDDVDEQLEDAETKMRLAQLTMQESDFDYQQFLARQRLDKATAERTWEAAQQAFQNYMEFDREYQIETVKHNLDSARFSHEYALEDLRQLERMYEEDELTEESEELVLKRARRSVESSAFRLRNNEVRAERSLTQTLPRTHENRKADAARAEMVYKKTILSLKIARQKKDIELDQAKTKLEQEQDDLDELRNDRKHLIIEAPASGLAYYGEIKRGAINEKAASLEKGSSITKDQVIMTIVSPKKMRIRAALAEKDLRNIKAGDTGMATAVAFPDEKLEATVVSVGTLPYAKGKYDCVISVKHRSVEGILPGMSCTVKFTRPVVESDEDDEQSVEKNKPDDDGDEAKTDNADKDDNNKDDNNKDDNNKDDDDDESEVN